MEDLMMNVKKIRYDTIGVMETRSWRPLDATFHNGEELFLGTCDSRGIGAVGVLVKTKLVIKSICLNSSQIS
ncbi:hypothetical protein ANCDUO_06219 [Ancylostoma duodenale]|uniref:Uncharacterized protein n=1 Tax=Ancylostoma duodenale TaxID=51022 RepID=A0A0C2GWP0_9BILA|nr:hypothetical protein ANCDUO_06219 [Ancylostoma duodenale]